MKKAIWQDKPWISCRKEMARDLTGLINSAKMFHTEYDNMQAIRFLSRMTASELADWHRDMKELKQGSTENTK